MMPIRLQLKNGTRFDFNPKNPFPSHRRIRHTLPSDGIRRRSGQGRKTARLRQPQLQSRRKTLHAENQVAEFTQTGNASWYGGRFHGRKTSGGERYDMNAFTAAHKTLPIPSYVRVTNTKNGKASSSASTTAAPSTATASSTYPKPPRKIGLCQPRDGARQNRTNRPGQIRTGCRKQRHLYRLEIFRYGTRSTSLSEPSRPKLRRFDIKPEPRH